ncbi:hypothetical protein BDZ97DRAFT_561754 [Flammula alnicola]|nr:hypothetical protein BDZ97DRAFT_561754 [Flammula alnicola]
MPIVEIVWWSATDDFLADFDALFKSTVDHVSATNGCLRVYYGIEEEDRTNFWMVVVWQSHAHHQAMIDRPDYPVMVGRLQPFFRDGQLKMNHIEFNKETDAAFNAPVTAISFLTLKEGRTKEEADEALRALIKVLDEGPGSFQPATWGETEEDAEKTILVVGWSSVQIHHEVVRDNTTLYSGRIAELKKITDIEIVHVKFKNPLVS